MSNKEFLSRKLAYTGELNLQKIGFIAGTPSMEQQLFKHWLFFLVNLIARCARDKELFIDKLLDAHE